MTCPASLQAATPNLKLGAWRVAIQMTIPNASGPSTGPIQYDRCLDPGNVAKLLALPPNAPCTLTDKTLDRDKLTWQMTCSQEGFRSTATGKIEFNNDTLKGTIVTVAQQPQNLTITTRIAGRYLGPCIATGNETPPPSTGKPLRKYQE